MFLMMYVNQHYIPREKEKQVGLSSKHLRITYSPVSFFEKVVKFL